MSDSEDDTTIAACNEMQNLDWFKIGKFPYVMKLKIGEDGYTVLVTDFIAVYGEHLNEEALQDRFKFLNPFAEMLPSVILKHLRQAIENIAPVDRVHEKTELKLTYQCDKYYFDFKINVGGMNFIYFLEPKILPAEQFKAYVMKPTLLKALTLDEENAALRRKIEELEGKYSSSSSSGFSERKKIKGLYSAMKESDTSDSVIFDAFLYVVNNDKILPESFISTNPLSTKEDYSASTSSSLHDRLNEPKNIAMKIPYEEDKPEVSLKSQNVTAKVEVSAIATKTEESKKDSADTDECDNLNNNLSAKTKGIKGSNSAVPPKREISQEDGKEARVSVSTLHLKPLPAKKKKCLRF